MTFTDRELLRLHVEAVWGVSLPALTTTTIELSSQGIQPDWVLYIGKLAAETTYIWRPDITLTQRQQLEDWWERGQITPANYKVHHEKALAPSHSPAMSLATVQDIARPLTQDDYPLLEAYSTGQGNYFLQPACAPLIGVIKEQQILSIAHSSRRTTQACELGVETHPQARRQGFALAATILWANSVSQEGLLPLYSALAENSASIRLAHAAGYRPFVAGTTISLS
ncbi:GNAT family N-acetyltransferase [Dictyobacter kobayashii]|uniref:N-acetyltransferase domain-containing protein n=1 Tax=Dictyobacter kobayashii TaxID=2014872 RepID=A0A402ALA4_9CHLR|nr:GNAT family N-acetyltransferase [Dictyobacter kobayashii]GCE19911.1 hypothetical protein KDK_37110 [Dictyobacter kobayashii]